MTVYPVSIIMRENNKTYVKLLVFIINDARKYTTIIPKKIEPTSPQKQTGFFLKLYNEKIIVGTIKK